MIRINQFSLLYQKSSSVCDMPFCLVLFRLTLGTRDFFSRATELRSLIGDSNLHGKYPSKYFYPNCPVVCPVVSRDDQTTSSRLLTVV